jgi:hypothetical protein
MNEAVTPPHRPVAAEIRRSLEGAARLFLFDAKGMTGFTLTVGGFWRSFLAALIAAPLYLLILALQDRLLRANAPDDVTIPPLGPRLQLEMLTYPLSWAIFPIAMIGLARLLKLTARYVPYVIAYNWANVIASAIMLVPLLLYAAGLLDPSTGLAAQAGLRIVTLVYLWFIARTALGVPMLTAAGLVAIDVLLSFLFEGLLDRISG